MMALLWGWVGGDGGRRSECAVAEHSGRRQTPALIEARAKRCTGHGLRVSVVVCDCGCGRVRNGESGQAEQTPSR